MVSPKTSLWISSRHLEARPSPGSQSVTIRTTLASLRHAHPKPRRAPRQFSGGPPLPKQFDPTTVPSTFRSNGLTADDLVPNTDELWAETDRILRELNDADTAFVEPQPVAGQPLRATLVELFTYYSRAPNLPVNGGVPASTSHLPRSRTRQ